MNIPNDSKVLILGGGISGLSAAWFLHRRGVAVEVLEAERRPGGLIHSSQSQGYLLEHGPNSTLQKPGEPEDALGRMVQDLELSNHLIEAAPMASKRYVMHRGRMRPLPDSPRAFLTTPVFSVWAKLRLLVEPLIGWVYHEESIAEFVRRRLGEEFLHYAIEPFISGVYAGDPKDLSVQAAVARIYALEQQYGSLIVAAIMEGKAKKAMGTPRGRLVTFDQGMGLLPATIARKLPEGSVRQGVEVISLRQEEEGWRVIWRGADGSAGSESAKRVVLALPTTAAASVLFPVVPAASRILTSIASAPIASTALGYRREQITHPLDGFGFLLPRRERVRLLGALFSSSLFPKRAADGKVLLTAFIGGAMDRDALTLPDGPLVERVHQDLTRCLGIQGEPEFVQLTRYQAAIPQYHLGHLGRIEALDKALEPYPGLHTCANWRDGISVANCIRNGELLAERLTTTQKEENLAA
ncbi:MAG: protoporphyrinogen oxidase [Magnetococcales bacterium]|nr:protoporphyrinogen oxidase [Magnetococcales bacterium]